MQDLANTKLVLQRKESEWAVERGRLVAEVERLNRSEAILKEKQQQRDDEQAAEKRLVAKHFATWKVKLDPRRDNYRAFKLILRSRASVDISLLSTEPIALTILDREEWMEYLYMPRHRYSFYWSRVTDLETGVILPMGTWHFAFEPRLKAARCRVDLWKRRTQADEG